MKFLQKYKQSAGKLARAELHRQKKNALLVRKSVLFIPGGGCRQFSTPKPTSPQAREVSWPPLLG